MIILLTKRNIEDALCADVHSRMSENGLKVCSCRLETNSDSGDTNARIELCPGSKDRKCCKRGYCYKLENETLGETDDNVELIKDEKYFEGDMEVDTMNILDEFDDPDFF